MTKKFLLATVLVLSLTMVSCSNTKPNDTAKSDSSSSTTTIDENKDNTNSSKPENKTVTNKDEKKVNTIKLSIYSIDENSLEPNESGTIELNDDLSLKDKLKELSNKLSEKYFNKLTIEVKSIDTINNKKVATINLIDANNNKWSQKFQGSTGGAITANTLVENFLQSTNKSRGEWIDGVKFLYNNKTIEYEHVGNLSQVQYRN